jgi:hypothetical protein
MPPIGCTSKGDCRIGVGLLQAAGEAFQLGTLVHLTLKIAQYVE